MSRSFLPGSPVPRRQVVRDASFLPGQPRFRDAYAPGKNPASHQGTVKASGQGPAGRIELVHGADLPDVTRGGRKVLRQNQAAVRVTPRGGPPSHTFFGSVEQPSAVRAAQAHFELMAGKPLSQKPSRVRTLRDAYAPGKNPASHGQGRSSAPPPGSTPHQVEAHGHLHAAGYSHQSTSPAGTHHYSVRHPHGSYGMKVEKSGRFQGFNPRGMQGGGNKSQLPHFLKQ